MMFSGREQWAVADEVGRVDPGLRFAMQEDAEAWCRELYARKEVARREAEEWDREDASTNEPVYTWNTKRGHWGRGPLRVAEYHVVKRLVSPWGSVAERPRDEHDA